MSSQSEVVAVFEWSKGGEIGWVEFVHALPAGTKAMVEHVGVMPKQGLNSAFVFGFNAGFIRGVLSGAKIPTVIIPPGDWQKGLMLPKRDAAQKNQHKRNLRDAASRLFPTHRWTLDTCDAALIAAHAVRVMP
jgi:hypothetical protein